MQQNTVRPVWVMEGGGRLLVRLLQGLPGKPARQTGTAGGSETHPVF